MYYKRKNLTQFIAAVAIFFATSLHAEKTTTPISLNHLLMKHTIACQALKNSEGAYKLSENDTALIDKVRDLSEKAIPLLSKKSAKAAQEGELVRESANYFQELIRNCNIPVSDKLSRFLGSVASGKTTNKTQQLETLDEASMAIEKRFSEIEKGESSSWFSVLNRKFSDALLDDSQAAKKRMMLLSSLPYALNALCLVVFPVVKSGLSLPSVQSATIPALIGAGGLAIHVKHQSEQELATTQKIIKAFCDNPKFKAKKLLKEKSEELILGQTAEGTIKPFSTQTGIDPSVRQQIEKYIIGPVTDPFKYVTTFPNNKHIVLLHGAPGTGKTSLMRSIGVETAKTAAKTPVYGIPSQLFENDNIDVLKEWVVAIHDKARADGATSVIFVLDEVGRMGMADRGDMLGSQISTNKRVDPRQLLNNMLTFLDGAEVSFKLPTVIVLTANNLLLDAALLRSGRINKYIELPAPNKTTRIEIFKAALPNLSDPDLDYLAKKTDGNTQADITHIIKSANTNATESSEASRKKFENVFHENDLKVAQAKGEIDPPATRNTVKKYV